MDRKEKTARRLKLSEHVNLGNGRFKDYEIEELESLVENRDNLDGTTKTYHYSYKTFDSEDTYRVNEENTYTFRNGKDGIYIEQNFKRHWDDGQKDDDVVVKHDTAREILEYKSKLFGKRR